MMSAYIPLWCGDICGDKECQHTYPNILLVIHKLIITWMVMTSAYVSLWRGDICGDKDCQHTYPNDCLNSDEETRIMWRNSCGDDVRPPSAAYQHLQSARHTHWVQNNLFTRRHKYMWDTHTLGPEQSVYKSTWIYVRHTHTGSRTICLHVDVNICETHTHSGPEQSVYMSTWIYVRHTHTGSRTICLQVNMNTCEKHTLGPEQSAYYTYWVQNNLFTCLHLPVSSSSDLEILLRMSNPCSSSFCEVAEHAYILYTYVRCTWS